MKGKSGLWAAIWSLSGLGLLPAPACAATPNVQFAVSATVAETCVTTATVSQYDTYAMALKHAAGTIIVSCSLNSGYQVGVQAGYAAAFGADGAIAQTAPVIPLAHRVDGLAVQASAVADPTESDKSQHTGNAVPSRLVLVTVSY